MPCSAVIAATRSRASCPNARLQHSAWLVVELEQVVIGIGGSSARTCGIQGEGDGLSVEKGATEFFF